MDPELNKLQTELTAIQAKINQSIGTRDTILKRMKDDFGVSSLAEANEKLKQLEAAAAESERVYDVLKLEYSALMTTGVSVNG